MAAPTPNEMEMVEKLRTRLENDKAFQKISQHEDNEALNGMFLRFLRARELNLNKAEDMLRKHLEWREESEFDSLEGWSPPPPISREQYPYEITGVDKEGCPVLVAAFGQWDIKLVCDQGLKSDYIRYVDQLFFHVTRAMASSSLKCGRNVSQFIIIFVPDDLAAFKQVSSRQAVDAVLETVRRFEANHPERLKAAFVVDTPKVFQLIFNVIRPLINSKTLEKVTIAGGSREWRPAILDLVEPQNLPPRLGGSLISKYPVLNKNRIQTPPSSLHRCGDVNSASFFSRTVPPGRRLSIEYNVPAPRTHLSWAFKTERWDVGFSILYDSTEVVVPYSRLDSNLKLQMGSMLCQHSGKYLLVFDNSFSRWRSKVVLYRVILRPQLEAGGVPNDEDSAMVEDNDQYALGKDADHPETKLDLDLLIIGLGGCDGGADVDAGEGIVALI